MLYDQLYQFQKNIVDKFKDRQSFGLFLDMGLGKTITAMALAEVNKCEKVIIVTINSKATESEQVKGSWFYWAKQSSISYTLYDKRSSKFTKDPSVLLVNYETLFERGRSRMKPNQLRRNILDYLMTCDGKRCALIIDESHKLKNLQSKQTVCCSKIKKYLERYGLTSRTYLLTGTPFTTGYVDLYSQLKMLDYPENKTTFTDDFCVRGNVPGLLGWQQPIVGYKNVEQLFELVHRYAITVKSEEVAELPEKIFVEHTTPWSKDFSMFTDEYVKGKTLASYIERRKLVLDEDYSEQGKRYPNPFFRNIAYPSLDWLAETSGTFWMRARQLSIGFQGNADKSVWYDRSRLELLEQFLSDFENNYILFYNYTPELLELYDICERLGYNVDVYCGECKSLTFYEKYASQSESERLTNRKNVVIANFASGSTGMNWQEYNQCIIFSLPLYKDYEQGHKRIHRLGQKSTVVYHIFSQNNWLDQGMRKALDESIDYSEELFNADRERIAKLMKEEDE